MKTLSTFLLICFGAIYFYAQNSTLTINIGDRCGLPIDAKVNTKLYYHNGMSTVLLKESTANPAIFSNLVANFDYSIETTIDEPTSYSFTIKDMILIQRHILGLSPLNSEAVWAADLNEDGRITAADLSELTKSLLGVSTLTSKKYHLRYETLPANVSTQSSSIFHFNGILNGNQSLSLYAGKIGNVAHTIQDYCDGTCNDITNRSANLLYDDILIEKDKEILVPIYISNSERYLALDFTLNIKNATLVDIKNENATIHRVDNEGNM
ncbi:MAG: dockerin type I repeat-containing protein [Chitinophagales bacterium]|nr:dockerin type I repeat-containing protein [Chitinophagales bacterium]